MGKGISSGGFAGRRFILELSLSPPTNDGCAQVYDLLNRKKKLRILEDAKQQVQVRMCCPTTCNSMPITYMYTHTHTHTHPPPTHTHTRTHTYTGSGVIGRACVLCG